MKQTKFCEHCGNKLEKESENNSIPFASTKKWKKKKTVDNKELVQAVKLVEEYKESESIFAEGLPTWGDIEPPQVIVMRKRK